MNFRNVGLVAFSTDTHKLASFCCIGKCGSNVESWITRTAFKKASECEILNVLCKHSFSVPNPHDNENKFSLAEATVVLCILQFKTGSYGRTFGQKYPSQQFAHPATCVYSHGQQFGKGTHNLSSLCIVVRRSRRKRRNYWKHQRKEHDAHGPEKSHAMVYSEPHVRSTNFYAANVDGDGQKLLCGLYPRRCAHTATERVTNQVSFATGAIS